MKPTSPRDHIVACLSAWRYAALAPILLLLAFLLLPSRASAAPCNGWRILPIWGSAHLNGLPLIGESVEIVGEQVKVVVETTPNCRVVTPSALPFEWQIIGPNGPLTPEDPTTLRPHFRLLEAGAYEARLIYCPHSCQKTVREDDILIPPQIATVRFVAAYEIQIPPATQPVLTREARLEDAQAQEDADELHQARFDKCASEVWAPEIQTPQLVPVRPWVSQDDYAFLEGMVFQTRLAYNDNALNHDSHDVDMKVSPDPRHEQLEVRGHDIGVEWESDHMPGWKRPSAGDRISTFGFHTYDCHHWPYPTEIHPPVLTAVHRRRAVRLPDDWPSANPLGSNIWVPGIVTDIWASANAGEITRNCSDTGLHQGALLAHRPTERPIYIYGDCIQGPHPLWRPYEFNIYLPENPKDRAARAGLVAPPVALYVKDEGGSIGPAPTIVEGVDEDGVRFLHVTLDLTGYNQPTYERRIVAAWALPSPTNWGLERWKVGIPSMRVLDDHDIGSAHWVFWASVNNRDQEWTRLLNGGDIDDGIHTFGGRPWETGSTDPARSLGPHLMLFNPPYINHFPGSAGTDLTRILEIHTSGYDQEAIWDDEVGMVQSLSLPDAAELAIGQRATVIAPSRHEEGKDYELTYFYERLGPELPILSSAGHTVVGGYTLGEPECIEVRHGLCIVLPATVLAPTWHPAQVPVTAGGPEYDWHAHPMFEPQEEEPLSLAEMPLDVLGRAVLRTLEFHPAQGLRFFTELREEYDEVRGSDLENEYRAALPAFEPHLPAAHWQRYFGDLDPTPVDLALTAFTTPATALPGESVVFTAEIMNRGLGLAAPFAVRLEIDGTELHTVSVSGLAPGASTTITFPAWTAVLGEHRLRASADALLQIAEPDEYNNQLERTLTVGESLPDLRVVGVSAAPSRPRPGEDVILTVQVRNAGGNMAERFAVRFEVDGMSLGDSWAEALHAGQAVEVTSPKWTAAAGQHPFRVTLDPTDEVHERDETNNVDQGHVNVVPRR